MKLALLGVLVVALVAQAGDAAPGPGPFENMGQVVLALLYLIGTIFNHLAQSRREERHREWLVEDREHFETSTAKTADRIREELIREQALVVKKLDQNTEISRGAAAAAKDAYTAANHVNEKIAAVGAMRRVDSTAKRRADDEEPQASG